MRRATALGLIAGGVGALAGCSDPVSCLPVPAVAGVASKPTSFGVSIYPEDDIQQAISLVLGCGAKIVRIGYSSDASFAAYIPGVFAAAAQAGLRVILITPYATQPVDIDAYVTACVSIYQTYAQYDPI
jgi:hypothetical protein